MKHAIRHIHFIGVGGAGVGGARGGGDVGVPQVRPAERPVEEAMPVVPGVEGWVGYSFSAIYAARKRKKREEEEEQSGGGEGDGGRRRWGSVEREEEEEEGRE